jgi:hypothetical protein
MRSRNNELEILKLEALQLFSELCIEVSMLFVEELLVF